jgi:hypothetical protein
VHQLQILDGFNLTESLNYFEILDLLLNIVWKRLCDLIHCIWFETLQTIQYKNNKRKYLSYDNIATFSISRGTMFDQWSLQNFMRNTLEEIEVIIPVEAKREDNGFLFIAADVHPCRVRHLKRIP